MSSAYDLIMQENRCERIKTIGDAYFAVSGMPEPNADHARCLTRAAIQMRDWLEFALNYNHVDRSSNISYFDLKDNTTSLTVNFAL